MLHAHMPDLSLLACRTNAFTARCMQEFQFESLQLFVENMGRYLAGQPLLNVCDKRAGY
jgi:hypothetical protein